ncbi:THUMP-like domain-containing protein [Williamsia sp. SKLECPSW1]
MEVDDVAWLASRFGEKALSTASDLALRPDTLIADLAALRARYPGRDAALVEVVRGRRRARGRLRGADELLLDDASAQQATASRVAAHRARRIAQHTPGAVVHDVTCSIGAELLELTAIPDLGGVIGSDLDAGRAAMAAHNVPGAMVAVADALTPTSSADVVIADPARRDAAGTRTFRLEDLRPGLFELLSVYAGRTLVVKCAPGLDHRMLRDRFGFTGETEVVSVDGGVREVSLWCGEDDRATRRATVMRTGGTGFEITDEESDDVGVGPVGRWIIDPDGAVVRAGLVRHYAARHGLWQLDNRIAHLTGDAVPVGERGWPVLEQVPFAEKSLRRRLAELDCGVLEIMVRGVDVDPDRLRTRLRLRGSRSLALVVTRVGTRATVFICGPGERH